MISITNYYVATSMEDAYAVLQEKKSNCILGGCMWLRQMRKNVHTAIDISRIGLNEIKETDTMIEIGAMVSLSDLERSSLLKAYYGDIFEKMAYHIVGTQFRNTATVGGSLYGRYGFSDVLTVFLPLNATVTTMKHGTISLEQFRDLPSEKDLLCCVTIPKVVSNVVYTSFRVQSTDFPILTICVRRKEDETHEIAIGARPEKASLVESKEEALQLRYRSNMRGSEGYRRALCEMMLEDVFEELEKNTK